jgi:hypothetical protein
VVKDATEWVFRHDLDKKRQLRAYRYVMTVVFFFKIKSLINTSTRKSFAIV